MSLLFEDLVDPDNRLNAFLLAFPRSYVNGRPVVVVFHVGLGSVSNEELADAHALLGVLREDIHNQMQGGVSIAIGLVNIGTTHQKFFDDPDLKLDHSQVHGASEYSTAQVHIHPRGINEDNGRIESVLPYS